MISRTTPFEQILDSIKSQNYLPQELLFRLPKRWRQVGTVGILELHPDLKPWKQQIGLSYLTILTKFETVIHKIGATTSTIRTPDFEILAGKTNTITMHKELKCIFWIDAMQLTFSTGNHTERQRLIELTKDREKIIDMFACVGNLSIPIGIHNPTCQIQGIELNTYAFKFLTQNIQANHLEDRYQAILGDNREVTPLNCADRVIMGFFENTSSHLKSALHSLKQDKGGILHVHGLTTKKQPVDWGTELKNLLEKEFPHFQLISTKKRVIKTVAPGVLHFVDDVQIICN